MAPAGRQRSVDRHSGRRENGELPRNNCSCVACLLLRPTPFIAPRPHSTQSRRLTAPVGLRSGRPTRPTGHVLHTHSCCVCYCSCCLVSVHTSSRPTYSIDFSIAVEVHQGANQSTRRSHASILSEEYGLRSSFIYSNCILAISAT